MNTAPELLDLRETVFVLGNGRSLKDVDLHRFDDVATIGMNAAYRYWERIGWYPTHYACVDNELIATHHGAIRSLVMDGLVRSAFVTSDLLHFHPDLVKDSRFVFLDSFRPAWRDRCRRFGLPELEHPAFATSEPALTTGAYAVRYGIYLGYKTIYLLGIDCNYVEDVEGAERRGGIALEIVDQPVRNPNYFFDDYQQKGDRYNIPNPGDGNLHLQVVETLRDDVVCEGLDVEIINCAAASKLNTDGVFPYRELDEALGNHKLAAVAVPMTVEEADDFIASLLRWNQPQCSPVVGRSFDPVPLVVLLNGSRDEELERSISSVFRGLAHVRSAFAELRFEYCELPSDVDVYERDYRKSPPPHGYKSGPNHQFFKGLELLESYGRYAFFMETDCFPIRPGWLSELQRLVRGTEPFWVMGSIYRGDGSVDDRYIRHINGNAIYAVGDPSFHRFVEETWKAALNEGLQEIKTLAYDCALDLFFYQATPRSNRERWVTYQAVAARFRYTNFIQDISGLTDIEEGPKPLDELRSQHPHTYLIHGRQYR